ncbi:hypothetical protein JK635_08090 [Neobacillus sp. YIM B02564]|uniref:Uncharacterized protein n=1 Tax=Neobacillus paridis TaxID=2803862 RepID=A0ABS1TLH6_9BACI|nr:hypothetical protein [Neobacillus paridis]MBL4952171.1 hypothetical protein [Neobacillus paridis]
MKNKWKILGSFLLIFSLILANSSVSFAKTVKKTSTSKPKVTSTKIITDKDGKQYKAQEYKYTTTIVTTSVTYKNVKKPYTYYDNVKVKKTGYTTVKTKVWVPNKSGVDKHWVAQPCGLERSSCRWMGAKIESSSSGGKYVTKVIKKPYTYYTTVKVKKTGTKTVKVPVVKTKKVTTTHTGVKKVPIKSPPNKDKQTDKPSTKNSNKDSKNNGNNSIKSGSTKPTNKNPGKNSDPKGPGKPIPPDVIPEYTVYWDVYIYYVSPSAENPCNVNGASSPSGSGVEVANLNTSGSNLKFDFAFSDVGTYRVDAFPISNFGNFNWNGRGTSFNVVVPSKYVDVDMSIPPQKCVKEVQHFLSGGGGVFKGNKNQIKDHDQEVDKKSQKGSR